MHSSRMRTVRSGSRLRGGEDCVFSGGGCAGGIPSCTEADPPPPVNRMTDRCKNMTIATSLRTVKTAVYWYVYIARFRFSTPIPIRFLRK